MAILARAIAVLTGAITILAILAILATTILTASSRLLSARAVHILYLQIFWPKDLFAT